MTCTCRPLCRSRHPTTRPDPTPPAVLRTSTGVRIHLGAMARSPELEALVRRMLSGGVDEEGKLRVLSPSPLFLAIGTDANEWWRGRDTLLAVEKAQVGELDTHREEVIGLGSRFCQPTHVEAFESGTVGWAIARSDLATSAGSVVMRSSYVFLLEGGTWRIVHMHYSVGVPSEKLFGFEMTTGLGAMVTSLEDDASDMVAAANSAGTVTVMFTDIEDSTVISEAIGDDAWSVVSRDHFSALRRIVEAEDGTVVKTLGDGGMFTFASARAGLSAAVKIQQTVAAPTDGLDFAVRIGLHSGDVLHTEGDYIGLTVNKAGRIAAAARGGEIMASAVTAELAGGHGFDFGDPKTVTYKGLAGTHRVVKLGW